MEKLKYTYSQLSSHSVSELVSSFFSLQTIKSCKYYVLGLHDNYLIEDNACKYILRIYRNDWRSPEEIYFELELLTFLNSKGISVAFPIPTITGELSFCINSPEGKRMAAIFPYAQGTAPGNGISPEQSHLLGSAVASAHQTANRFETKYSKKSLDISYLLDDSIRAIERFLDSEAQRYMKSLQKELKEALPMIPKDSEVYGICLGDVNPSNFHINSENKITLFDFDQCGHGYRAFEVGKFISSIHSIERKQDVARSFIDGYQKIRRLNHDELRAIPYFEIISVIWVMAIHAYNANRVGYKLLKNPFWHRRLAIIKQLESLLT